MSLVGGLGSSMLAFIMPTLFYLKLQKTAWYKTAIHGCILAFGVTACVVTTVISVIQIIEKETTTSAH